MLLTIIKKDTWLNKSLPMSIDDFQFHNSVYNKMQEVDLINQDELDKNLTILNNEFEQLIQNDFISNTMVTPLVNWITNF